MSSILDPNFMDEYDKTIDRYIHIKSDFDKWFRKGCSSVLLIDKDNEFSLSDYKIDGLRVKYFDLSECGNGDYHRIGEHLNQRITDGKCEYDGLIFDNADQINVTDKDEKEYLEELVYQAMKRDEDYQMLPFGQAIPFDKMMIAVRCREFPEYLKGKSMQWFMIDTSDKEIY